MMGSLRYIIVFVLLIAAAVFVHTHEDVKVPVARPLTEIPLRQGPWSLVAQSQFSQDILDVLRPTDYLSRVYRNEAGEQVSLYLGFHGGGPESGPIHSPKNCLPGSGWFEIAQQRRTLQIGGETLTLVEAVYQKGEGKELFLYWYQVRGDSLSDEYALKLAEVKNSIFHSRRDSAFIRISLPFDSDQQKAVALGESFVRDFYPQIVAVLPK